MNSTWNLRFLIFKFFPKFQYLNILNLTHGGWILACAHGSYSLLAFAMSASCFLGLQLWASTLGFPRPTRNWIISGPLRRIIVSLGCFETLHSHLKNLFGGTGWYHLFFNYNFPPPSCSSEGVLSTHFTNFPNCGMSSLMLCPVSTLTIHGLLTDLWFLANYSWLMTPTISWRKRLLLVF